MDPGQWMKDTRETEEKGFRDEDGIGRRRAQQDTIIYMIYRRALPSSTHGMRRIKYGFFQRRGGDPAGGV